MLCSVCVCRGGLTVGVGDKSLVGGESTGGKFFSGVVEGVRKFLAGGGDSPPSLPVGKTLICVQYFVKDCLRKYIFIFYYGKTSWNLHIWHDMEELQNMKCMLLNKNFDSLQHL